MQYVYQRRKMHILGLVTRFLPGWEGGCGKRQCTYCPTDPSATHLTIHTDQRQIYIILTLVLGPIEGRGRQLPHSTYYLPV
jgi:hypothetical protein